VGVIGAAACAGVGPQRVADAVDDEGLGGDVELAGADAFVLLGQELTDQR